MSAALAEELMEKRAASPSGGEAAGARGSAGQERGLEQAIYAALLVFLAFVPRIAMSQLALAAAIGAFAVLVRRTARRVVWPSVLGPAAVLAALTVASCLASANPGNSLSRLREFALYGIVVVVPNVVDSRRRLHGMVHALLGSAAVLAVWGIVQYLTWGAGVRIRGPLRHWMTYAGILVIAACLGMAFAAFHPCRRRRVAYAAITALLLAAIALTLTRGAYLAVVAAGCLLVLLQRPAWLLALPLVLAVAYVAAPVTVRERLASVGEGDVTLLDRLYLWRSGFQMVADHPVLGLGLDELGTAYRDHYRLPDAPKRSNNHLHNNVLQIAAERGLPALLAWLAFFVVAFRAILSEWRRPGRSRREALAGALIGLTAFHVFGLGEYNFGDSEILMLVLFLVAIPYVEARLPTEDPASPDSRGSSSPAPEPKVLTP